MLKYNSGYIGYDLDSVIKSIANKKTIIIEWTQTIFEDKQEERKNNKPIVIRQKEDNNTITLTAAYFK